MAELLSTSPSLHHLACPMADGVEQMGCLWKRVKVNRFTFKTQIPMFKSGKRCQAEWSWHPYRRHESIRHSNLTPLSALHQISFEALSSEQKQQNQ